MAQSPNLAFAEAEGEVKSRMPIGSRNRIFRRTAFSGIFADMGHTIAGPSVSANSVYGCYSLFGIVKGSTVKNLHLEDGSTTNATGDAAGIVSLLRGNSRLGLGLAERRHSSTSQWRSPCSAGRQATGWVYMVSLMRSTASTRRSSGVVSEMRT